MSLLSPPALDNPGTLRLTASGWLAQFSLGHKRRKGVILRTCADEASATRRKLAIAKLMKRLRETGYDATIPNIIRDAGAADADAFRILTKLVERMATGNEPGLSRGSEGRREGTTVEQLRKLWTSGKLAALMWDDGDLEHGMIQLTKAVDRKTGDVNSTKSEETRPVPSEPGLRPLLQRLHDARATLRRASGGTHG